MPVILQGVSVRIGKRNILDDVSLSFFPGINFIVGRNGSGKSTLIHSICGLTPYSGSIQLDGIEISGMGTRKRAQGIALISQRQEQTGRLTVEEFVLLGRYPWLGWSGTWSRSDLKAATNWIEFLGLSELKSQPVNELSGGEFQKVLLCRGLCQEAPVIMLDEPAQNLDPPSKEMLYSLLKNLESQSKIVVCVTHDREPLQDITTQVFGIRSGSLAFQKKGGIHIWDEMTKEIF